MTTETGTKLCSSWWTTETKHRTMIKVKFDKASAMMRVDESLEFADETAFVRWLEDVSDTGGDPRDGRAAGFSVIVTYIAYDFGGV